jgi:hypothetical protein
MKKFKFNVLYKNWANGEVDSYDVMPSLYGSIFNSNGSISKKNFHIYDKSTLKPKPIKTKKDLMEFIRSHFIYLYRYKCEWEFIVSDWPSGDDPRERKIDVYQQLEPNLELITDLLWNQIKDKL